MTREGFETASRVYFRMAGYKVSATLHLSSSKLHIGSWNWLQSPRNSGNHFHGTSCAVQYMERLATQFLRGAIARLITSENSWSWNVIFVSLDMYDLCCCWSGTEGVSICVSSSLQYKKCNVEAMRTSQSGQWMVEGQSLGIKAWELQMCNIVWKRRSAISIIFSLSICLSYKLCAAPSLRNLFDSQQMG